MKSNKVTYIIFGASGDLSRRYLLPAAQNIQNLDVVLISRTDYGNLKNLISKEGNDREKIFHLAIPPEAVPQAIELISNNFGKDNENKIKIILEKPFGSDLKSAQALVQHTDKYFSEDQIYRVDHYLAKKSLQSVVVDKWDRSNIKSIEIIASEKIDIEGRANFYEEVGALKDFVQSHLLEMLAVVLSASFDTTLRYKALKNLEIVCDIMRHGCVKRGQYSGYREEVSNRESSIETFVSINLVSNDPVWKGVKMTLSTGKALREKLTQIKIEYNENKDGNANNNKKTFDIKHEPEAYERVLRAAMEGRRDLFISRQEILESWRILEVVQQTWKNSQGNLVIYPKGSSVEEVLKI